MKRYDTKEDMKLGTIELEWQSDNTWGCEFEW